MDRNEATHEEWRRLFDAAIAFKKLGCWEWMSNDDYFAVTDPETGETGYCVILGAGGMEFGLNVYFGEKAGLFLRETFDIMDGQLSDDRDELLFNTKAISLSLEDRGNLDQADLSIIRELGYKFRGANEWPQFRSYEPGLIAWTLNGPQVRFLTAALEQTIEVGERFRENNELYSEHDDTENGIREKRLHRVPQVMENGVVWRDEWLPWHAEGDYIEPYTYPDELRLRQLKKNLKKSNEIWESDFDFAPIAIGEKGARGYYPRLCLWVSQETEMIMDVKLVEKADCRERYVKQLIDLLEKLGHKPARIEVGSLKALLALKHSAGTIGIPLRLDPSLDALLDAKDAIIGNL
ncbi:DUF6930 domain-containing protein [Paenibacillus sp. MBLB4367]|uniref:DUF7309 domain-containing protein n=1 Tax=Paenibacillus sp. MBLB4367 TaxID=3384767 RepID=UPI0039081FE7